MLCDSIAYCEILRIRRIYARRIFKIKGQKITRMLKSLRGGILVILFAFCPFLGLKAVELSKLCNNGSCEIKTTQSEVTNNSPFSTNNNKKIELKNAHITNFTNTSTIKTYEFSINGNSDGKSYIEHFYNYGSIETSNTASLNTTTTGENGGYRNIHNYDYISGYIYLAQSETGTTNITNYGEMGGVVQYQSSNKKEIIINNYGTINLLQENGNGKKIHFKGLKLLTLKNYAMRITSSASVFNNFDGNAKDNSHLVLDNVSSVSFADASAKMILDFGGDFEAGKEYALNKLVVDTDGNNKLSVEFSRLVPRSDLFSLSQRGDYFIATLNTKASTIGNLYKSNIRTMNNFWTLSNSMIYPRKSYYSQNLTKKNQNNLVILREQSDQRISKSNIIDSSPKAQNDNIMLDSTISLKSYESFSYRNESVNRRIQRQNKRNYSRTKRNNNSVILSESEESQKKNNRGSSPKAQNDNVRKSQNLKEKQRFSQNLAQNPNYSQTPHNYYFILTPFVNHNSFAKSGNYNLSGFDYGFLTAFSAKVAESNSLGAHFIFSYGSLGDSKDKDLSIKSLNLNIGLNYKLDLIYDMYLKARGDFYYFSNALDSLTIKNIKPNNLGFGVSVAYGKDFNFGNGGILGIEAGIDYKALQSSTIPLQNNATKTISETYQKSLYNLIYVDLGMSYNKYFGNFGLNATLGIKGNITANKLATSKIHIGTFNKSVDMVLDNDNFLGYANLGASYVLNHKDFDMEFSLAYYGNYGDRVISNGGGVEWRVLW